MALCNITQLTHPTFGRKRFIWKPDGNRIAILSYCTRDIYRGSITTTKESARATWEGLVKEGWKRCHPTRAPSTATYTLSQYDKACLNHLG